MVRAHTARVHGDECCTYCNSEALTYRYIDGLPTPVCGAHAT